jgi:DNA-binding PadR family transcriptional regulator
VRKFSELEGVCLGVVYQQQPCTAYFVRRALKQSPSSHWQASAGSVYPLLARLEEAGLIKTTADESDGRGRKLLDLTTNGRKALSEWVKAGADPGLIAATTDPVRSRTFFLSILSSRQQQDFLRQVINLTEVYLEETQTRLEQTPESEDLYGYLGALGATMVTRARLDWLKEVRDRVCIHSRTGRGF